MRYSELYQQTLRKFDRDRNGSGQITDIALDIQILIEKTFGLSRSEFWINKNHAITDKNRLQRFHRYVVRLQKHEPLAYIIQEKSFFNDVFRVNKHVLIPRPETELLVEKAIEFAVRPMDILEIGAGSGNIAISLAKATGLPVEATENQAGAFRTLQKNIAIHQVSHLVSPVLADLFPENGKQYDLIISNPPYLSRNEWTELPLHIRDFEPRQALVGGPNGHEVIERITVGSGTRLKKGGCLLIEIGFDQKRIVERLLRKAGFREIRFSKDYNHIFRVASGQL